jgi:hypothetical protein
MSSTYLGQPVQEQPRDSKGMWARPTRRKPFSRAERIVLSSSIRFVAVAYAGTLLPSGKDLVYTAVAHADGITEPSKIEELKDDVVDGIKRCESAGKHEDDGIVTFDPDRTGKKANIPSYGVLQFKVPTVIAYERKLHGITLTPKQAILLALDEDKATALAKEILFTEDGATGNWYNCSRKTDAAATIKIIKKLEK